MTSITSRVNFPHLLINSTAIQLSLLIVSQAGILTALYALQRTAEVPTGETGDTQMLELPGEGARGRTLTPPQVTNFQIIRLLRVIAIL